MSARNAWAVLLAAGDGSRLQGISRDEFGRPAPKQYCSFGTGRSLLAHTLDRARRVVAPSRTCAVVAEHHREWWLPLLAESALSELVVQPRNRGTGAGILLPLWRIAQRDPAAVVVVLPSDHFVDDEAAFGASVTAAMRHVEHHPEDIVLLGVTPEKAESEYGWIVPAERHALGARRVAHFVEKPASPVAARLMDEGGLWNSFVFACRAWALLEIYRQTLPDTLALFARHLEDPERGDVKSLYAELPASDFSRDVLEAVPDRLRVLRTPACGWTDLGTPTRLESWRVQRALQAVVSEPEWSASSF